MNSIQRIGAAVLALVSVGSSPASAQSDLALCRIGLAEGNFGLLRAHESTLANCLRFANYSDCPGGSGATNVLTSDFYSAIWGCLPFEEALLGAKLPFWYYNYTGSYERPEFVEYQFNQWGLNYKTRNDLDLPSDTPSSVLERKCISSAYAMMTKAVRAGLIEQIECAREGGEPPWNCTIDTAGDSRLARALTAMDRKISKCRDASGRSGSVSGAAAELCNRAVVTTEDLAACLRQTALCQICTTATSTLGLGYDCAEISGDRDCDPSIGTDFGKLPAGSFVVANEGDDTVTVVSADGHYAFGDLAASTFAVGSMPVDVAIGERTNVIVSVNRDSDDVTLLSGRDGSYLGGSLATATVPVGDQPSAAVIQPRSDFLYVANRGSDSVTLLDAWDGSYVFGTLAASTVPVGAGPTALAVAEDDTLLYVANGDEASVSFLNARTGLPAFGTLPLSTFPVGNHPSSLALYESPSGPRLAVANRDDDSVVLLDATTGAPADGTISASSRSVAAGPVAIASLDWDGSSTVFVASATASSVSALREGTPWLTNDGEAQEAVTPLDQAPGDLVVASGRPYRNGAPNRLIVSSPNTDRVFQMSVYSPYALVGPADAERAMIPTPLSPMYFAVNDATGGFYMSSMDDDVYNADPVSYVDVNGQVQWKVQVPSSSQGVAYSASKDTVFVGTTNGVIYLDASDGSYKFGTKEASLFSCGCSGVPKVVNEDAGLLYVICPSAVAFLDTSDGSCRGPSNPAIPVTSYLTDIAYDRATGILYVGLSYGTGSETRQLIVRYDAASGQWYDGGFDESVVYASAIPVDYYWYSAPERHAVSADGQTLYVLDMRTGKLSAIDIVSRAITASTNIESNELGGGEALGLLPDPAGGPLLVFRRNVVMPTSISIPHYSDFTPLFDDVVYLDEMTLALAGGDLGSSRLVLGETDNAWQSWMNFAYDAALDVVAVAAYEMDPSSGDSAVSDVGPGLVLLRSSSPSFARDVDASEIGSPVLTGDRPGALAAMPAHTELDFLPH